MARIEGQEGMRELVAQWRTSGEKKATFARAHGLSRGKFEYWLGRLGGNGARRESSPRLLPVRVVGRRAPKAAPIEIVLASGDVIRTSAEVPAEALGAVIRALRC